MSQLDKMKFAVFQNESGTLVAEHRKSIQAKSSGRRFDVFRFSGFKNKTAATEIIDLFVKPENRGKTNFVGNSVEFSVLADSTPFTMAEQKA